MSLDRLRWAGASVEVAALIVGASVGAACWAVEAAVVSSQRSARLNDVRDTLRRARTLLSDRQQAAAGAAASFASSPVVQNAFASRDATTLARIVRRRPALGFVLWDGRTLGRQEVAGLGESVAVYARGSLAGRVVVDAAPNTALLERARGPSPATRLAFTISGHAVLASPAAPGKSIAALLQGTVNDSVLLNSTGAQAQLVGFRARPSFPVGWLWPVLLGIAAAVFSFRVFERRETRRRAEPPPNTVRDAVALVGETLAATHNPDALLPVILQAAVEATSAAGGRITVGENAVVSRGAVDGNDPLDITLDVPEGPPATMTLFPAASGFSADARDAAAWIAAQAVIALENARLHGLVQRQAVTDELTGLPNRRRFLTQLDLEVTRSRRSRSPLGIVLADLDDFKRVNDTYGHEVGDDALRAFADILRATVRDVDLPVRLGGEEFAVLLPDTDLAGAVQLAERVRQVLEAAAMAGPEGPIRLTASFGVSCFPAAVAAEELLSDADRRLYDAKRLGKNRVVASEARGSNSAVR